MSQAGPGATPDLMVFGHRLLTRGGNTHVGVLVPECKPSSAWVYLVCTCMCKAGCGCIAGCGLVYGWEYWVGRGGVLVGGQSVAAGGCIEWVGGQGVAAGGCIGCSGRFLGLLTSCETLYKGLGQRSKRTPSCPAPHRQ